MEPGHALFRWHLRPCFSLFIRVSVQCETEEAHAISLTKRHERDLRHVPYPSVSTSAPRCLRKPRPRFLCPCSKVRARGHNPEHDGPVQSMGGSEGMESTCEAKKTQRNPQAKKTFPEARLKAVSGGLQGGHHRR